MQVQLCKTSGALVIATLPSRLLLRHRSHRLCDRLCCGESRPCYLLRAIHFPPLPCSDFGQGVAMIITALMLPRFFAQTHKLSGRSKLGAALAA